MRICFDLDNTLCSGKPYLLAQPFPGAKDLLSQLRKEGHTIIIQTARGMGTNEGHIGKAQAKIGELTFRQLRDWGFEYDEIYFGKPSADLYVDDKALGIVDYEQILGKVSCLQEAWSNVSEKLERLESSL